MVDYCGGYIKDYHGLFKNHLRPGTNMLLPSEFCVNKAPRCFDDLNKFIYVALPKTNLPKMSNRSFRNKLKRDVLKFAFSYTFYGANPQPGNFELDYLKHISENFTLNEQGMTSPECYCREEFIFGKKENNTEESLSHSSTESESSIDV